MFWKSEFIDDRVDGNISVFFIFWMVCEVMRELGFDVVVVSRDFLMKRIMLVVKVVWCLIWLLR